MVKDLALCSHVEWKKEGRIRLWAFQYPISPPDSHLNDPGLIDKW